MSTSTSPWGGASASRQQGAPRHAASHRANGQSKASPQQTVARHAATQQTPQQAAPREEILLGRYRVLERRGTGGFGTVCTCWDLRLQRRVAIKRMPIVDEAATTTAEEALAEARTACMLAHPNIVTVYDFESDGTYAYLVMEYVDGLNLAELLARVEGGRLTAEECAHVLDSVTKALAFAHENRVLHLDIKPTNIMVDRQGVVKLADFGMAALASAAGYGGARGGTVGYMPPEQIQGMLVDERTDVFSLAVVVWQALTGQSPFAADSAAASLRLIEHGPRLALGKICPELAGEPALALGEALSFYPAERPADVRDLADDLLPSLGDPREGAESLRELVEQAETDDGSQPNRRAAEVPPLLVRMPWIPGLVVRGATALAVFSATRSALPQLEGATDELVAVVALVCAGAAAVWTPLGSALVGLALVAALWVTGPAQLSLPLALAVAAVLAWWWLRVGRRGSLTSLSMVLPCCLPSPVAGAAVAGYSLRPLEAAVTGAAGFCLGTVFQTAVSQRFVATAVFAELATQMAGPRLWVVAAGCAACGLVVSLLRGRGTTAAGVAGQILGLACLLVSEIVAARMENGSIWGYLDGEAMILAVFLASVLCIATAFEGPIVWDMEGEDDVL